MLINFEDCARHAKTAACSTYLTKNINKLMYFAFFLKTTLASIEWQEVAKCCTHDALDLGQLLVAQ